VPTYDYLKNWVKPNHCISAAWDDWYSAGVGKSRDSDTLERANFDAMLAKLAALPEVEVKVPSNRYDDSLIEGTGLVVVRENHWAVGWIEWIAIHETNTAALEVANAVKAAMEDYPVIDESLWSDYEDNDCCLTWQNCYDERERVKYLRDHVSPEWRKGKYRELRAAVKGSWYDAANLLPYPSDLIA
jgi:hypothetical protein